MSGIGVFKLCADCRTLLSSHRTVRCAKCHLKRSDTAHSIKKLDEKYIAMLRKHKGIRSENGKEE